MSLSLGIAFNVMQSKESNHKLLMRFYELDKEISASEEKEIELFFTDEPEAKKERKDLELSRYFMFVEAKTILRKLNIN